VAGACNGTSDRRPVRARPWRTATAWRRSPQGQPAQASGRASQRSPLFAARRGPQPAAPTPELSDRDQVAGSLHPHRHPLTPSDVTHLDHEGPALRTHEPSVVVPPVLHADSTAKRAAWFPPRGASRRAEGRGAVARSGAPAVDGGALGGGRPSATPDGDERLCIPDLPEDGGCHRGPPKRVSVAEDLDVEERGALGARTRVDGGGCRSGAVGRKESACANQHREKRSQGTGG
jgi:hypothetical protein